MAGHLMSTRRGSGFKRQIMGEINVTPFVDVMLVLLIVFMISAPLLTQGVQVSLPEVENAPIKQEQDPITITLKRGDRVYIQEQEVAMNELTSRLKAIQQAKSGAAILLRADKNVPYGQVMSVMSSLQTAGLVDVGLVTEPPKGQ